MTKIKKVLIPILIFLGISITSIHSQQYPHIPVPHEHGVDSQTGACWGYAVGRAFNRSWGDSRCPIETITFNSVSEAYFDWHSPFEANSINQGDIIAWGGKGAEHVAYVTNIYSRDNSGIILADRQNYGSPERTNLTLAFLINERGEPSGYFTKKKRWEITVKNNVDGSDNVGQVGVYGGGYSGWYPFTQNR